jgi:predicted Fe-Mo cluster-binding NifX family protein
MKVGVLAEGDTLGSLVAEDFGHAPYFLIVDLETLDYSVVENEFANGEGAGYKVAGNIVGIGVDHVVCGGIGTHGLKILQDANIRVWYDMDEMTVEEAVRHVADRVGFEKKFE